MKMSLLQMVQSVLSLGYSDPANSISDTDEAMQVALLIRDVYLDIMSRSEYPHKTGIVELESSLDTSKPTVMTLPIDVESVESISYDRYAPSITPAVKEHVFKELKYMEINDFTRYVQNYSPLSDRTQYIKNGSYKYYCLTDTEPTYYTTTDRRTFYFDSYNKKVETTLQSSKTIVVVKQAAEFIMEDSFVPVMPIEAFPYLLSEVKSQYFAVNKEANPKLEQQARQARGAYKRNRDLWRLDRKQDVNYARRTR